MKQRVTTNIGIIYPGIDEEVLLNAEAHGVRFNLVKAFIHDKTYESRFRYFFPETELVEDINQLTEDTSIELVMLSSKSAANKEIVDQVIQSGKHLRIL